MVTAALHGGGQLFCPPEGGDKQRHQQRNEGLGFLQKIAGIEGREEVGKLKVEAIVADGLSRCRIAAGADDILDAFQAGYELRVEGEEKIAKKTVNAAETGRDVLEAGRKAVDFGEKAVRVGEGISRIVKMLR